MKHKRWLALLVAAVLTVSVMSVPAFAANSTEPEAETSAADSTEKSCRARHGRKSKPAEPENAVGKDVAKERALTDAGVSAEEAGRVKARVVEPEDGTVVYRVSFSSGELWYCYKIEAVTGEILNKTTEDAAAHEAAKAARRDRSDSEAAEDETEAEGRRHRHGGGKHGDTAKAQSEAGSIGT